MSKDPLIIHGARRLQWRASSTRRTTEQISETSRVSTKATRADGPNGGKKRLSVKVATRTTTARDPET